MDVALIALTTLLVYSAISTTIYIISKENENVAIMFGIGIFGWFLMAICWIIRKIQHWHRYHDKRSIIEISETGEQKWCNLKDTNDIYAWHKGYKLIKRYAGKNEWYELQPFEKEFVSQCKINCDNCVHNGKECDSDGKILCKDIDRFEHFKKK